MKVCTNIGETLMAPHDICISCDPKKKYIVYIGSFINYRVRRVQTMDEIIDAELTGTYRMYTWTISNGFTIAKKDPGNLERRYMFDATTMRVVVPKECLEEYSRSSEFDYVDRYGYIFYSSIEVVYNFYFVPLHLIMFPECERLKCSTSYRLSLYNEQLYMANIDWLPKL